MRLLHPSGDQPHRLALGQTVEAPRRSLDSCGCLPGAVRVVLVELFDVERVRSVMPAVFAVGLVLAGIASVLLVAGLEVVR